MAIPAGTSSLTARPTSPWTLDDEANQAITDLDLAPTDNAGLVTFSARFRILKPVDPDRGNQRLLYEVVNRGNPTALRQFNDAVEPGRVPRGPHESLATVS